MTSGIEVVRVDTADQMRDAVLDRGDRTDVVIMAAAVADFRPKAIAPEKIKKGDGVPEIVFEPTADILAELGAAQTVRTGRRRIRGRDRASSASAPRRSSPPNTSISMVANDVSAADAGFEVDTNRVLVLDTNGGAEALPLMTKAALAGWLVERIAAPWDLADPSA